MKHVGKMKNNSARVVVVYRTLPDEPHNALVVGTQGLQDSYHDSLMSLIDSPQCQQANELADMLAVRKFPDGNSMLGFLHGNGHLKKVPTNMVLMTPDSQTVIQLDELNKLIAEQKGVRVEDLAVREEGDRNRPTAPVKAEVIVEDNLVNPVNLSNMTPAQKRSRADALYKEAAQLRKEADELDPPKSRKKPAGVEV